MTLAREFRKDLHQPSLCSIDGRGGPGECNFMTNELVAVFGRPRGLIFEISAGSWGDGRIFGVTVWSTRWVNGRRAKLDPDPSRGGFRSLQEALDYAGEVAAAQV